MSRICNNSLVDVPGLIGSLVHFWYEHNDYSVLQLSDVHQDNFAFGLVTRTYLCTNYLESVWDKSFSSEAEEHIPAELLLIVHTPAVSSDLPLYPKYTGGSC